MVWFVSLAASPFIASMTVAIWPTSPPILMPFTCSLANKVFFHAGYSLFWPENYERGGRICRVMEVVPEGSISIPVAISATMSKLSEEYANERDEGTLNVAVLTTNDASVLQAICGRAK